MLSSAPRDARVGVDAVDLRAENERLRARVLKLENALSAAGISIGGAHEGSSTVTASGPHRTAPCLPLAAVSQPTLVAPTNIATIAENGIDSLQRIGAAMHAELASESADSGATSERAEQFRFGHVSAAPSLDAAAIRRYSRQMILPCVGAVAQANIMATSVLIVGCGGLGSPCALYLAGAGIGRIGLVDSDVVELDNLHRQIMHSEHGAAAQTPKAASAAAALARLNSSVRVEAHCEALTPANAVRLIGAYDIVVDCTDNAVTRYLLSDAAVVCARPLVSGAAIGAEGQLTVYGYRGPLRTRTGHVAWYSVAATSSSSLSCVSSSPSGVAGNDRETSIPSEASTMPPPPPLLGPCYRCLFPQPPPAETVASCSNAGVLGPVPGIIGCMQALEVLKLAACSDYGIGGSGDCTGASLGQPLVRRMLLLDGLAGTTRSVRLRDSQGAACVACANDGRLTRATIAAFAYSHFCGGAAANDKPSGDAAVGGGDLNAPSHAVPIQQVAPREFARILQRSINNAGVESVVGVSSSPCRHVLLDVRDVTQFGICALPRSINVPLASLRASWATLEAPIVPAGASLVGACVSSAEGCAIDLIAADDSVAIYLVCRRGRQSLKAARVLVDECGVRPDRVFNVRGGLAAWSREVDTAFPSY